MGSVRWEIARHTLSPLLAWGPVEAREGWMGRDGTAAAICQWRLSLDALGDTPSGPGLDDGYLNLSIGGLYFVRPAVLLRRLREGRAFAREVRGHGHASLPRPRFPRLGIRHGQGCRKQCMQGPCAFVIASPCSKSIAQRLRKSAQVTISSSSAWKPITRTARCFLRASE